MFDRPFRRALWRCAFAVVASQTVLQPAQAADEFAVTPAQMQSLGVQLQRLEPGGGRGAVVVTSARGEGNGEGKRDRDQAGVHGRPVCWARSRFRSTRW